MSSELFENYELDFNNSLSKIRKFVSQIANYNGEQRKTAVRAAEDELETANELLQEMDMESRSAPPSYRTKLNNKLTRYTADMNKLRKEVGGQSDRNALFGGGGGGYGSQSYEDNQRGRIMQNSDRLNKTSDRLANAQRIGAESEAIGHNIIEDLADQRETIIRTGYKVHDVDSNLGRSRKILNSMTRRIMTNKIIMFSIVVLLFGILGIVIFIKLKK